MSSKENINTRVPSFKNENFISTHTEELDIEAIKLALTLHDIKLYAISPNSALSEILPLAPVQNSSPFEIENKPEGYICDLMKIPNPLSPFKQKIKDYGITDENIFFKSLLDLKHIVKAILYAIRGR